MSTVTPIRGGDLPPTSSDRSALPTREVIEKRLDKEVEHLCRAHNILRVVILLLDQRDDGDDHVICGTLLAAKGFLDGLFEGLESVNLLRADGADRD